MSSPNVFQGGFSGSEMQVMFDFTGDPGWIRTSDLQLRRLLLYPLSYGAVGVFSARDF
jgi:hypothetical protein